MNRPISRTRLFFVLGGLFASAFFAHAELAPHRIQISLNLSPRPLDGAPLKEDTLFDQKASLKIKVVNLSDPAPNVQIQWMFVYDDVSTSGKIERGQFSDVARFALTRGEEKTIESRELRFTGKISKKGLLSGMRYEGYGVRIYDAGRLVHESYQPQTLKKGLAELVLPPDHPAAKSKDVLMKNAPAWPRKSAEEDNPPPDGRSDQPPHEKNAGTSSPAKSSSQEPAGGVTLFEQTFSKDEAQAALCAVNELSESDLVSKVGVPKQSAEHLVAQRPFKSIEELPKVSYVKSKAIIALKEFVRKK
ncbi:MAG: hypothetical protein HY360_23510 [Verrucomicrobia bacterium]|nr:hypothetical protein [Verrucomicrobiota bacterium]